MCWTHFDVLTLVTSHQQHAHIHDHLLLVSIMVTMMITMVMSVCAIVCTMCISTNMHIATLGLERFLVHQQPPWTTLEKAFFDG